MKELNQMEIKFKALSENEGLARTCASAFCLQLNPTVDEITDIKTAVSEAVTNCVVHAYPNGIGEIIMQVSLFEDHVDITVSDVGIGIDNLEKAREPFFTTKPDSERSGMGFTVMESFMDKVLLSKNKNGKGTCVNMTKYIGKQNIMIAE